MKRKLLFPPIYPITDKKMARSCDHYSILKELVRGGARFVQIRDKYTPAAELLKDLRRCVDFASSRNVTLILNDRCDLVLCSGAFGVHLGQDDLPPETARTLLGGESIIGLSTHSLPQVRKASLLPVQYIGFGPIFPTSTKENAAPVAGLSRLRQACNASSVPVVAIGGIGLQQVGDVLKAGASSVAIISALMQAVDLTGRMQQFLEAARGR
ncbi:MAG: thiamine phosphate synthase [Acidobacteria bacterium]|nr:thiamine phosphate synthase [Acidobacteriota bacterium]